MTTAEFVSKYWPDIAGWTMFLHVVATTGVLCWILHLKRETMSAIAWCLTVILVPFLGVALFYLFGYQTIHRPIAKKKKRKRAYKQIVGTPPALSRASREVTEKWDVLAAGANVYQYTRGMMHSKYMLVDGEWASVGSANMDNRSLLLNYEMNCLIYDLSLIHI